MKPFDLEAFKAGTPAVRRDGELAYFGEHDEMDPNPELRLFAQDAPDLPDIGWWYCEDGRDYATSRISPMDLISMAEAPLHIAEGEDLRTVEIDLDEQPVPHTGTSPYGHYFKDVRHLDGIDVYRVLDLFGVTSPAVQHAIKKLLVAGGRGAKDYIKDIAEARDSLDRALGMIREEGQHK